MTIETITHEHCLPPHHRSYSLAVTKLEEAKHWLRDRKHKPA